jgi:hypothetical protein
MSEQLKELMGRLADEAGPAPQDPVLWQRARKSRRRDGWVMATVAAVAVLVVTGSAIVGVAAVRDDPPPPADEPTEPRGEPGIPSAIEFPFGDGALELERDLAVGRASVAIANNTAAFVITADDGVYHRLDLPGFDPALYADGGSEVSGLALSPDGTKLVYGWQGTSNSPKESGARLLDLQTGEVTTLARQTLYDEPARLLTWGFSWSPDSRFVVNRVKIADPGDPWTSGPHWRQGLDTRTGDVFGFSERNAGLELPADDDLASTSRVASSQLEARGFGEDVELWLRNRGQGVELPASEFWVSGQFDASGSQFLAEPDRIARSLALLTGLRPDIVKSEGPDVTTTLLRMTAGPADVSLLGWVGRNHALAVTDDDFEDSVADLVLLALDVEAGTADATVVGEVPVSEISDLSLANDLASVETPTRDFETGLPSADEDTAGESTPESSDQSSDDSGLPTLALVGAIAAVLTLAAVLFVAVRRRRA